MKKLNFSIGVIQAVQYSQNGYCACKDCVEKIVDFHHVVPNTKSNQKKFPLFLQSPFNCRGLCRGCHDSERMYEFKITDKQVQMYEYYLQKLKG